MCCVLPFGQLAGSRWQLAGKPYYWFGHCHNAHAQSRLEGKIPTTTLEACYPLQISSDPLTGVVGVDINPFPWLLSFTGRATVGHSGGDWEGSLLSKFYKPGNFHMFSGRAWHSRGPISFAQEGSLLFQSGGGSWFLLSRPQQGGFHNIVYIDCHQRWNALLGIPDGST